MINIIFQLLTAILIAYLIGSIPTGYIVVKLFTGQDIRTIGSGSTGATNVKRVMGTKWFFTVMLLDGFKGAFPVILAKVFATVFVTIGLVPVLCSIAVILGHSKSVFLNFSGGKSVATGIGAIIALNWHVGVVVAAIWTITTYWSRYVSLGSIIAIACAPFLMKLYQEPSSYIIYCSMCAVYIIYLHKQNIRRLVRGEEHKVR